MEANEVLLTMALRDAGIELGAKGAERLCASLGRLGIAMSKAGEASSAAAIATVVPSIAIVTIEITRDATRVEIGPR